MEKLTAQKYRELFKLRAEGKLDDMECTKSLFNILEKLYSKGIKILDVPCGAGHYLGKLRELGDIDYFGIDLDSKAIEMANEIWGNYPNARFDVQDASKLNLEDSSIDIVFCYNLLLHLKSYEEVLQELFRVSRKYIIVRSLFDDKESVNSIEVDKGYLEVYKSGTAQYNSYARKDVINFLKGLGPCKLKFIPDNLEIPDENLKMQVSVLGVKASEFSRGKANEKQYWKGLSLNYEVIIIEKMHQEVSK